MVLNEASNSRFVTRKWNIVNDQSNTNCDDVGNEIIYKAEALKSNFCNNNDGYTLVRGDNTVIRNNEIRVAFKNCAPFIKEECKKF